MILTVNRSLKALIPELDREEYDGLERSIVAEGCRFPLIVWGDVLIDGHNRYEICTRHNIPYEVQQIAFESEAHARVWMRNHALRQRNLSNAWKIELALANKADLLEIGRAKQAHGETAPGQTLVSKLDRSVEPHSTRKEIAKKADVSTGTIARAEQVREKAPELWEKAKAGDLTIGAAYNQVRKEDRRQEKRERIAAVEQANLIEANDKITVQHGDVWQLGRHTLYCGDTTTHGFRQILTIAEFAFADPPYGAGVDEWDNAFVWDHDYLLDYAPIVAVTPGIVSIAELMRRTKMPYRWSTATWITNGMTRGALGFGNWIYTAIFANRETSLHRNAQDHHRITISTTETDDSAHRGRKPSAYMAEILSTFTEEGNTIIDCFLGSGTTLLAAEKLNRTCIGGELNPEYCASIISRWQALTGQKAVRL